MDVELKLDNLVFRGSLDDSDAARALAARLPLTLRMVRWGDEYIGILKDPLDVTMTRRNRENMEVGDLVYWGPGRALCLFLGPNTDRSGLGDSVAFPAAPIGRVSFPEDALRRLRRIDVVATLSRV